MIALVARPRSAVASDWAIACFSASSWAEASSFSRSLRRFSISSCLKYVSSSSLRSVDIETREPAEALRERTDSCTVPAAGVVGEAMVAFVLADAYRRKFGGDHIDDVIDAVRRYEERIEWRKRSG